MNQVKLKNRADDPLSLMNIKYDLSKNFVLGESPFSLMDIVLRKVALLRLQHSNVQKEILTSVNEPLSKLLVHNIHHIIQNLWHNVREKASEQLHLLCLPKNVEEELKKTIDDISKVILTFLYNLKRIGLTFTSETLETYTHNVHLTAQGTIDYTRTVILLVENNRLNKVDRYTLVSNYFLIDRFKEFDAELLMLDTNDRETRLSLFWAFYLNDEDKLFHVLLKQEGEYYCKHYPVNENEATVRKEIEINNSNLYLLEWAIERGNEVAVQFFWENMKDLQFSQHIEYFIRTALISFKDTHSSNILCYLLSKVNHIQQIENIFAHVGVNILKTLGRDPRWLYYFTSLANIALKFIPKMEFGSAIKSLAICWIKNVVNTSQLKDILQEHLGINLKTDFIFNSKVLIPILLYIRDAEVCRRLLGLDCAQDGKQVLYHKYFGSYLLYNLLARGRLNLLETFMKEVLTDLEINKFKSYVFWHSGLKVSLLLNVGKSNISSARSPFDKTSHEFLLTGENHRYLDQFLASFCHKDQIIKFKEELPYKLEGEIVSALIEGKVSINRVFVSTFGLVDDFLDWCFDFDEKKIAKCKLTLFDLNSDSYICSKRAYAQHIRMLISKGPNPLNAALKWGLSNDANILEYINNLFPELVARNRRSSTQTLASKFFDKLKLW